MFACTGGEACAAESNLLANGGFETAGRLSRQRLSRLSDEGIRYESADPLLPMRWTWSAGGGPVEMALSPQARSGRFALRAVTAEGSSLRLHLGVAEVVPGATYHFGALSRGDSRGAVVVQGHAFEGAKELARQEVAPTAAWKEFRCAVTIPGNVRTVTLELTCWGKGERLWDDAFVSAELARPYDPDSVLTSRPVADADTLALVDFDRPGSFRLEEGAHITADGGGRFGRGLRLERRLVSGAVLPISLQRMPPEGTLEFWIAPDDVPEQIYWFAAVLAGDLDLMRLQADTSDSLRLCWRTSEGRYDSQPSIACPRALSRDWFRPGQWQHVAIQWDDEAVRYYLNGVLFEYSTERPLPFFKTASAIKLGALYSVYAWSGAIDEVRLSKVRRYGPFIPVGAKWSRFVAADIVADRPAPAAKPAPPPDFAGERAKQLRGLPAPPADAPTFDARQMKPLIDGDEDFRIEPNQLAAGMKTARIGSQRRLLRDPDLDGAYWRLAGITPGRYNVGVWYESGKAGAEAPQGRFGALMLYLNGRLVQWSTASDPVQVAPGVYFAEAQSGEAVSLGPGDEIAVLPESVRPLRVARLTLYPSQPGQSGQPGQTAEPGRGHNWIPENYGGTWFSRDTALRLSLDASFGGSPRDGFRQVEDLDQPSDLKKAADGVHAQATCRISNPLPVPLTIEFTAQVQGYFRESVGDDRGTLTLQPHQRATREIPFTIIPDSRRYTIATRARAVNPPSLGWPQGETIAFFPGVRQTLPWPDPFVAKEERSCEFLGPLPSERTRVSLDGPWQSAFTAAIAPPMPPPASLEWTPRRVPFLAYECPTAERNPRPHGIYLRRCFTLSAGEVEKTHRLTIGRVADEATVYVNGQKVGNVRGGDTPLVCDVTRAVRPGENELLIVSRDMLAIMDPDYVNPASPTYSVAYLDAPGGESQTGFSLGHVTLDASPPVAASDLLILPSVRKGELAVRVAVMNHRQTPVKTKVAATVLDAGKPVLELGAREVSLQPGQAAPLTFIKAWRDPVLWGPENPKLYTVAVETVDAAGGRRLDLLRERFGFRECWINKDRIYFNGAPVRLKGSTCQGGGGVLVGDIQWSRGTHYPDFMDEFGYPVSVPLAAIYNSSSRHNVDRDAFWDASRSNVLAAAAQWGNHPCVIAWDLSNEWLSFLDYGGGDPMKGARRFHALDAALKQFDPSRWSFFNGDEDLGGLHDNFSSHYMLESTHPHPISGFGFRGHSNYFPDGAFFRPLDETLAPGRPVTVNVHRGGRWRVGEKPLLDTENLWKQTWYMPPGPSKFAGEDDVLGPGIDSGRGPIAWMWKQNLDGHRDLGVSAVCNYTPVAGVARRGHAIQCFIMPEHTHHYFAGAKIDRDYSLHNDLFVSADFVFRWELRDATGRCAASGEDKRRMASGDLQRGRFSLIAPAVSRRTQFTLQLILGADGKPVYREDRGLEVWPDVPIGAPSASSGSWRRIVVFDPAGTTAAALRQAGIAFTAIAELTAPAGPPADSVLIVGEGATSPKPSQATGKLTAFVAGGGRIVVLAQDRTFPGLPVKTALESKEWSSMPFVRTPQHPALAGVSSWDLHFWRPDHVAARGAYSKPESGSFVALVDSGSDLGLEWVQMMECYRGRGLYMLCQLPVAGSSHVEPMARELLSRIVAYAAGGQPFRSPVERLLVSTSPSSPAWAKLRELGVSCAAAPADGRIGERSTLWVDADALKPGQSPPPGWINSLAAGATIVVHGARPEHGKWLSALAARPVTIGVQPLGMWDGRAYRNGYTWLTPGLSHIDLYWKRYDGSEGAVAQAEDRSLRIDDVIHYSVSAAGGVEHVFPGGLLEIPVGRGRIVVDQIRWETPHKQLSRLSARVISSLTTGLGVAVEPFRPTRELPRDIVYKPIDLTKLANRGFIDEVGDDGRGGWSDQGPNIDLRSFPTGQQSFGGVPFRIGAEPHCCIVLKSDARPFPERLPAEVTIPLGFAAEGLCFLHGTTYAGNGQDTGLYRIEYADGTTHDITLVADENIRDWVSPPGLLPREKGTQSRIAWTGTTKVFPVVSVFQMLWVNPNPEVRIKAVRFANAQRTACPILIAMTTIVRDEKAAADRRASQARAAALLDRALAAFQAGHDAEARELAKQSLREDAANEEAHRALLVVCERLKDEDAVLAACRAWLAAGTTTPVPCNRLGEILERRKDYKAALDAYTRSLALQWNQPPVIEAKKRLERLTAE